MEYTVQIKANLYCNRHLSPPTTCQANDNDSIFLDQFTNLLTLLPSKSKNIVILGDINMHIDNIEDHETQTSLDSLAAFNLT